MVLFTECVRSVYRRNLKKGNCSGSPAMFTTCLQPNISAVGKFINLSTFLHLAGNEQGNRWSQGKFSVRDAKYMGSQSLHTLLSLAFDDLQ